MARERARDRLGVSFRLGGWAGLRNVLAHHYPLVDFARVHAALQDDLGDLEAFAAAVGRWLDS